MSCGKMLKAGLATKTPRGLKAFSTLDSRLTLKHGVTRERTKI
jgi:hypothetical protein